MSGKVGVVASTLAAVLICSVAFAVIRSGQPTTCPNRSASLRTATGHAGHADRAGRDPVHVGPTCNVVEHVGPVDSTYRPDVAGASRGDRRRAQTLLAGVNAFCRTTSVAELANQWVPGTKSPSSPTHFFNPHQRRSLGLDPANPRAALVYGGRIGGVMLTGTPLPALGSVPRAHTHDPSGPREMLHVYCTTDLADAFTPSRDLGVMADTIALRQRIRPLVAGLQEPQVGEVLAAVRAHADGAVPPTDPRTLTTPAPGDPVLLAAREEIRQSLMFLSEQRLRTVLSQMDGSESASSHPPRTGDPSERNRA